jgi:hypothetical protein
MVAEFFGGLVNIFVNDTKTISNNYPMVQVASQHACKEDCYFKCPHLCLLMEIIDWQGGWLLLGHGIGNI